VDLYWDNLAEERVMRRAVLNTNMCSGTIKRGKIF